MSQNNLLKNIQNYLFSQQVLQKKDRIIVAVSGGPDSVFLLNIFNQLAKKYQWKLGVAHINYNLRGKDSQRDEKLVENLAQKFNYPFYLKKISLQKKNEVNENFLREIRYNFFEKIRQRYDYNWIVVGHNQDDQAETLLLHLIRGSGLQGLSAMNFRNNYIVRPLLNTKREEIINYLQKYKIEYRKDKSNKSLKFLRNKIRWKLLPYLEKNYNSKIKDNLAILANNVADDYNFLRRETEKIFSQWKIDLKNEINEIIFQEKDFLKLDKAIQKMFLRLIWEKLRGSLFDFYNNDINEMLKIIRSQKNKIHLFKKQNITLLKKGDKIIISKVRNKIK